MGPIRPLGQFVDPNYDEGQRVGCVTQNATHAQSLPRPVSKCRRRFFEESDNLNAPLVGIISEGMAGAIGLTRFLSSLLFEVQPTDSFTFVSVSLLLIAVALLACSVPARRAAKVDPMVALRYE